MTMIKRLAKTAGTWCGVAIVLLVTCWCVLSLYFNPLLPGIVSTLLAFGYAISIVTLWTRCKSWWKFCQFAIPLSMMLFLLWCCVRPTHEPRTTRDGAWSRLHAVMPQTDFEENGVVVRNVRSTIYHDDGSYTVLHDDRRYDLRELDSIWFGEQHFASFQGVAHTFVSFGFNDGEYVSISAEARRGEGENFSPLRGFFKQFGLIYVVSTEADAIGRTLSADMPIYLYPIRASPEQIRAMFVHMLQRANDLHERPEFYHTAHNNCASNIVDSFNAIAPIHFSQYSPFLAFPGYSGKVAYNRRLIDTNEAFPVVQKKARVNELARTASTEDFSTQIRANFSKQ